MDLNETLQKFTGHLLANERIFGREATAAVGLQQKLESLYRECCCLPQELGALGLSDPPAQMGELPVSLAKWLESPHRPGDFVGEATLECLQQLASIADVLALSRYRIPVFLPSHFAYCADGTLLANWSQLSQFQLKEHQRTLEPHQRQARYRLHPMLTRELPTPLDAILAASMRYSFAMFLLELWVPEGMNLLQHQMTDQLRACTPALPPEVAYLLCEALHVGPLPTNVEKGCERLCKEACDAWLAQKQWHTRRPSFHLCAHKESYALSGRHKRGAMQDTELTCAQLPPELLLTGIADGVSTADLGSGEAAVHEVARTFEEFGVQHGQALLDASQWPDSAMQFFSDLFAQTNRAVVERWNFFVQHRTSSQPIQDPMSSTLLAAAILGDTAVISWVGDSVAWHYQAQSQRLLRLTIPHNQRTEQLQQGDMAALQSPDMAEGSGLRRMIGDGTWEASQSAYQPTPIAVDAMVRCFAPGDILLLASDGLCEGLHQTGEFQRDIELGIELKRRLERDEDLQSLARNLAECADQQQGNDNITLVVIRFEQAKLPSKPTEKSEKVVASEQMTAPHRGEANPKTQSPHPSASKRRSRQKS